MNDASNGTKAGKAAHQFLESGKSTGKILLQPESK
jgi:hypothetical protein